ncbi:hypothetical protein A2899_02670 [Candidatus Amesbacteria bacterium RIFCSPLOWO2_01_FULL_49_25]|uniref:Glycosyl transferase family 28 C-terminal domain-containing protein n=1 Tax=Candidatus Amesbacteria bacterium RIFCSPHIGHO2_01_FULL_48_32b TaxID=1797253 RepID=A0A1F4YES7_9BACT|nr:MAG: hypothetical protein A2876_05155 [Candidatus Amesbacteria bacterium RIFCSPHIGHO2_01_FULL_48_32b]OGD07974.1 MAG: hypothetical protein A2899_02670 [Candidatus Amesbacteria bacterium RIFCSPLOWO2_01_FULL_49_25]
MAQSKILFVGRLSPDTGYDVFLQLAKLLNSRAITVTNKQDTAKYFREAKFVFAAGFLTILEAAVHQKLIFASYSNPIRRDYLVMHPLSNYMIIGQSSAQLAERFLSHSPPQIAKMVESAYFWAKDQTWQRLANQYEQLWKI